MGNAAPKTGSAVPYQDPRVHLGHDLPKFICQKQIGNGKFMKSYEAKADGVLTVVKVYMQHPTEDVTHFADKLSQLWLQLNPRSHPNLLPYQIWLQSSARASKTSPTPTYLIRQFMMSSLYDRLSTRPFLTNIEKRWVLYQLFRAVEDCHQEGFTHGDIKLENVLVSSWNWVVLTDFASFKPTYLPDDDPTDYNYYFDLSDRSRCAIAPERFRASDTASAADALNDFKQLDDPPTRRASDDPCLPSMDVFSLGCAAMEVMMDGEPLLDLPALLQYRAAAKIDRLDASGSPVYTKLGRIEDRTLREVLCLMTQKDPNKRKSVREYREVLQETGIFPSYFHSLMYDMALQQHTDAVLPDARIEKLCLRYGEAISALTTLVDDQGTQFFTTCTSGLQSMRRDSVGSLPSLAKERTVTELKRQASVTSSRYSVDSIDSLRKAPEASGITLSALLTASKELLSQIEADISALRQNGTIPAASDREERIRAQSPFILAETAFAKAQELGTSPAKVMEMDYGLLQQLAKMQSSDALESSSEPNTAPRARTRISFDGPILLVQFVCSSIRHVRYPQTRMVALQLLVRLGLICSDVVLLQRIIPYAVDLLHDPVTPVRAVAVVALRTLLTLVETFTAFDSNLFPRYIFPALNEIARETEEVVRVAFVESIGRFAEASKKFLDRAQLMRQMKAISEQTDEKSSPSGSERTTMGAVAPLVEGSYDKQLRQLHDQVAKWIRDLLSDGIVNSSGKSLSSLLKRILLQDIVRLCNFFGQDNVEENLLTQLLTFLNDPDWELRHAFCARIPSLCAFLGGTVTVDCIFPCIENALHDAEELVVAEAVRCMTTLVELSLLTTQLIFDNVKSCIPLFLHPRSCIRDAAVTFLVAVCKSMERADTYALVLPLLRPVLTYDLIGTEISAELLIRALDEPVTRREYRRWVQEQSQRQNPVGVSTESIVAVVAESHEDLGEMIGAFGLDGGEVLVSSEASPTGSELQGSRKKTLSASGLMIAPTKRRAATSSVDEGLTDTSITLDQDNRRRNIMRPYIDLVCRELQNKPTNRSGNKPAIMPPRKNSTGFGLGLQSDNDLDVTVATLSDNDSQTMHVPNQKMIISNVLPEELRSMTKRPDDLLELRDIRKVYGVTTSAADAMRVALAGADPSQLEDKGENSSKSMATPPPGRRNHGSVTGTGRVQGRIEADAQDDQQSKIDVRVDAHIPDPKIVIRRIRALNVPPLPPDLGALIQPDGRKFSSASETLVLDNALDSQTRGTWRPRQGVITLTFSEHVRAVNRLAVSQDQTFFVSASDDRTAKIWSLRGLENSVAPRSTLTYATHKGKVLDVCVCENTHSVATCSDDGSVHVWRVDVEHDSAALYETSANTGVAVTGTSVIKTIDPCEGPTVNLHHFNNDRASILLYTTQRGKVHSWDLRSDCEPWTLSLRPELGYLTSLTLGQDKYWLCVGTSRGYIALYDIRYNIMSKLWQHSSKKSIFRLASCKVLPKGSKDNIPEDGSYIFVAAGTNEAAVWGVPSGGECIRCFRSTSLPGQMSAASTLPLPTLNSINLPAHPSSPIPDAMTSFLSGTVSDQLSLTSTDHSVRAIMGRISNSGTSYLVTAGTDRHIRLWDFHSHTRCYTVSGAVPGQPKATYDTPSTDGLYDRLVVCYDATVPSTETTIAAQIPQREQRGPIPASSSHKDAVLDLKSLDLPMRMMLSCSRDGEIKAWR